MIALIVDEGFPSKLLQTNIAEAGHEISHFESLDEALADEDTDIIFIHHSRLGDVSDLEQSDKIVVGLEIPPDQQSAFDLTLNFPIDWHEVEKSLGLCEIELFAENTKSEILNLLGQERYVASLNELISDTDQMIEDHPEQPLPSQIECIHKVSGVSAMLGVEAVHKKLLSIEVFGKSDDLQNYEKGWSDFLTQWPKMKAQMEDFISGH